MGAQHVGKQARLMSQALRKLTAIVSKTKTVVIVGSLGTSKGYFKDKLQANIIELLPEIKFIEKPIDPALAAAGTIRRDFGESKPKNVVHRSDSSEAAAKEIGLLFTPTELI